MKKTQWLWWVNILLAAAFVIQLLTVLLRDIINPRVFFTIHIWCGRTLLTLATIHLILNWNWVKTNIMTFFKKPLPR
jgi:hypothetical protein